MKLLKLLLAGIVVCYASGAYAENVPPIVITTQEEDYNEVKKLIKNGADVNAKSSTGNTALMWASGAQE